MKLFLSLLFIFSTTAFATDEAAQKILNAITVCPVASNPLAYMKKMGGNALINPELQEDESVTVEVMHDPQLLNPLIMMPSRILGKLHVQMLYPEPGRALKCVIKARHQ